MRNKALRALIKDQIILKELAYEECDSIDRTPRLGNSIGDALAHNGNNSHVKYGFTAPSNFEDDMSIIRGRTE